MRSAIMPALDCSRGRRGNDNLDTDNVTPLPVKAKCADNTAALRQRRSRAKRKSGPTVTPASFGQITQREKPNENNVRVTAVTAARRAGLSANRFGIVTASYVAAFGLATVSSGFSITG
jgi:hypothetical protein